MFAWLRRLLRRLRGQPPQPPHDPFNGVRHPRTLRPGGKSAAVAVEEPDEDETLMLVAGSHDRRAHR